MDVEAATPGPVSPSADDHDPLAALAAALGSEPRDAPQSQHVDGPNEFQPADTGETTTPAPHSGAALETLQAAYAAACASSGVEPLPAHQQLLDSFPTSLYVDHICSRLPRGNAGGVVVDVAAVAGGAAASARQMQALLQVLTGRVESRRVLLVDHLKLSGLHLPDRALPDLVAAAAELAPWWRLRSLELSGCGLSLPDLDSLSSLETSPAVEHLQRLDLSRNSGIGRSVGGQLRSPGELMGSGRLLLTHLWRAAPLRFLDLTHTDLSSSALAAILRMLRTYVLPSSAPGCAVYLHDGTRPALQCLRVGPPPVGDAVFALESIQELCSLAAAAPQLGVIEVLGVAPEHRPALQEAWAEVQHGRGLACCAAEVQPGLLRLAAGAAVQQRLPSESAPAGHTLPGPETPPQRADPSVPLHLDDWVVELAQQPPVQQKAHPSTAKAGGRDTGGDGRGHPQGTTEMPPRRPLEPSRQRGQGHSDSLNASLSGRGARHDAGPHPSCDVSGVPTQRRRPRNGKSRAAGGQRATRTYRGGAADQLPDYGIDLVAEDEARSEEEAGSEESEGESDGEGGSDGSARRPGGEGVALLGGSDAGGDRGVAALHEQFRLRDGRIDEDSRMGRQFQKTAKALCQEIPRAEDRVAAVRAFRNWSRGINAWDRRRWVNPSRDQHDNPSQLNALNLLLDLFAKYGKRFDFPFPAYVPGAGATAFEDPDAVRPTVSLVPATRSSRPKAGGAARPAAHAPVRRPSKFLQDGGRGHGSDGEEEADPEMEGFLCPDSEDTSQREGESGSESGSDVGADGIDAGGGTQEAPALVGQRRRRDVLASSSEDEDEGGRRGPEGQGLSTSDPKVAARQARQLAMLSAWNWDKHVQEHPPNQAVYGQVQGKRQRRHMLNPSQIMAALGSQEQEMATERSTRRAGSTQRRGAAPPAATLAVAPAAQAPSSSDDDDDDVPLVTLRGRPSETAPAARTPAAGAATMHDGEEAALRDLAPGSDEASPASAAALSPAELAASAAQQLLGNLYVSPAPLSAPSHLDLVAPAPAHPGSVAAGAAGRDGAWGVIPDSQEEG